MCQPPEPGLAAGCAEKFGLVDENCRARHRRRRGGCEQEYDTVFPFRDRG